MNLLKKEKKLRHKFLFKFFLCVSTLMQISAGDSKAETVADAIKNADQLELAKGTCLAAILLQFRYDKDHIGIAYLKFADENRKRLNNVIVPQLDSCAGDKKDNNEIFAKCAKKLTKKDYSFYLGYMVRMSNMEEILVNKPPYLAFGNCDLKLFPQVLKP